MKDTIVLPTTNGQTLTAVLNEDGTSILRIAKDGHNRGIAKLSKAMTARLAKFIAVPAIATAALLTLAAPSNAAPTMEDSEQWSCVDMGNRICGPGNTNGVPAGRYDAGGVLVDAWPINGMVA